MSDGYIYCFSNSAMPGILKIGMTDRNPNVRLNEANSSDTWRPPTPYKIEFAKRVSNPKQKEQILHKLLSQYTERINPRREFFRVSSEEVKTFFEIMDGELWKEEEEDKTGSLEDEEQDSSEEDEKFYEYKEDSGTSRESVGYSAEYCTGSKEQYTKISSTLGLLKGCRDMKNCFTDKQRIRHVIGINKTWIGVYNSQMNVIIHNEKHYKSLSGFAEAHYSIDRTDRVKSANGWKECECEVNGKWISTFNL